MADDVSCSVQPKQPSFADPPSALICDAKAAFLNFQPA
jgi:hypothetical protein